MEPTLTLALAAALLIFGISAVFAALGLGGGMLYVPVLTWLGLPLKTAAIPLGLLLNGLNTLLAFLRYWREGLVDFRGGTPAAAAALVLAPLGAWSAHLLPTRVLLGLFAVGVLVAALRSLTGPAAGPRRNLSARSRMLVGLASGGLAGFVGGMLGLGGGFIIAPVMMELGYEPKAAAATTAYVVTFSSFSGFLGHAFVGLPGGQLLLLVVLAVVAGSQLGAWYMACRSKPQWVRAAYGVVLLGVAVKLGFDLLR
ncbi:MAG: sulfite exporter TauE/SafE family protein [Gammaproteobacteria bacterium]|nr:sulfite exporter TauE/SafE family protein [Gammaproteobacteria bacterium]